MLNSVQNYGISRQNQINFRSNAQGLVKKVVKPTAKEMFQKSYIGAICCGNFALFSAMHEGAVAAISFVASMLGMFGATRSAVKYYKQMKAEKLANAVKNSI